MRGTYWVVDGLLLAGSHPGPYDEQLARASLGAMLDAGIRIFVDLTEPRELESYEDLLREEARARGVQIEYSRVPIRDRDIPSHQDLAEVLATIERALAAKRPLFVHCWGGIGRTGTVIGCWLAQNGYPADAALERLSELRCASSNRSWRSPETDAQRDFVRTWRQANGEVS